MVIALPASAAGPWVLRRQMDTPATPRLRQFQHQKNKSQPDEPAGDRDRIRLQDGSCGACPNR